MRDRATLDTYRLYRVNAVGRIAAAATPITAADDNAAVRQATSLTDSHRAELWLGTRLVARVGR